jgi:EAL domain-containing protein (putative c-di-GMP-specific phosphodiesterase class I)
LAERLADCVPDRKQLARIGADHFAVVVPDVQSEGDLVRMVDDRFWRCFHDPFRIAGTELRISAKFGIALYPNDAVAAETLYRNAEAALKKAKAGSERVLFYNPRMTEAVAQKLALENKLRQALENEEFLLFYQPKVDVDTRRIEGVEALIRWRSPELGLVPPMQFIPLMEETGLILEVGAWALRRAVLDHKNWLEQGLSAPRVAVNVSAVQLRKHDFVATVLDALKLGAASPGIDIEITESLIMEDIQPTIEKLHALRALGISVSIDDFGTGYSSLAYLAKLPVQVLKIDRAFISTMLTSPDNMTLVSMMIGLAHALRLKVVAEGVEVEEEARMLNLLRCDQMQGYLVGKPVPFEDMSALIRNAEKRSTVWADL